MKFLLAVITLVCLLSFFLFSHKSAIISPGLGGATPSDAQMPQSAPAAETSILIHRHARASGARYSAQRKAGAMVDAVCRNNTCRLSPLATSTCSTAARLIGSRRWLVRRGGRGKETQQEDSMKYLLMIVAAIALVGTASATSRSADCCGGGACCLVNLSCCAK